MRTILAIFKKEMYHYFASFIAYVLLAVFALISGMYFLVLTSRYSEISWYVSQRPQMGFDMLNIAEELIRPYFSIILTVGLFITPLITMRLFSEERKQGTLELLLTAPVKEIEVILGKFMASLLFYLIMITITLPFMGILIKLAHPETGPIIAGYTGIILVVGAFIAIGEFISSLTENQIISAILTFGTLLIIGILSWISTFASSKIAEVLSYLSLFSHFEDFAKGVIDTKHIIFYLSFMLLGLVLTYFSIESWRWRG